MQQILLVCRDLLSLNIFCVLFNKGTQVLYLISGEVLFLLIFNMIYIVLRFTKTCFFNYFHFSGLLFSKLFCILLLHSLRQYFVPTLLMFPIFLLFFDFIFVSSSTVPSFPDFLKVTFFSYEVRSRMDVI